MFYILFIIISIVCIGLSYLITKNKWLVLIIIVSIVLKLVWILFLHNFWIDVLQKESLRLTGEIRPYENFIIEDGQILAQTSRDLLAVKGLNLLSFLNEQNGLYKWFNAIVIYFVGYSAINFTLINYLFGLLLILLGYKTMWAIYPKERHALFFAGLLAVMPEFIHFSAVNLREMMVCFFVLLTIYYYYRKNLLLLLPLICLLFLRFYLPLMFIVALSIWHIRDIKKIMPLVVLLVIFISSFYVKRYMGLLDAPLLFNESPYSNTIIGKYMKIFYPFLFLLGSLKFFVWYSLWNYDLRNMGQFFSGLFILAFIVPIIYSAKLSFRLFGPFLIFFWLWLLKEITFGFATQTHHKLSFMLLIYMLLVVNVQPIKNKLFTFNHIWFTVTPPILYINFILFNWIKLLS